VELTCFYFNLGAGTDPNQLKRIGINAVANAGPEGHDARAFGKVEVLYRRDTQRVELDGPVPALQNAGDDLIGAQHCFQRKAAPLKMTGTQKIFLAGKGKTDAADFCIFSIDYLDFHGIFSFFSNNNIGFEGKKGRSFCFFLSETENIAPQKFPPPE